MAIELTDIEKELKAQLGDNDDSEEEELKRKKEKEPSKTMVQDSFDFNLVPQKINKPLKDRNRSDKLAMNLGKFLALLNSGMVIVGIIAIIYGYFKSKVNSGS